MRYSYIKKINRCYDNLLSYAITHYLSKNELGEIIRIANLELHKRPSELVWEKKWEKLGKPNVKYFRVFSQYIGENDDIVPDNICHNVVEHILNPDQMRGACEDKNLFDLYLSKEFNEEVTPNTILRCIDGSFYDKRYKRVDLNDQFLSSIKVDKLIVKPSVGSSSGNGITFYDKKKDGVFVLHNSNKELTTSYIKDVLPQNFVAQECMTQSDFMAQFCATSINTIRIATYRSIITNEPDVLNCIMRIGNNGAMVDNAHAGGCFIGVSREGRLGNYLCNQYGEKFSVFNGIDFSKHEFVIPDFQEIIAFAKRVASCVPHMRLLQLDIAIDNKGLPKLIEYNVSAFAPWLYQFTIGPAFGKYTDEIIDYCFNNKDLATRIVVSF